MHLQRNNCECKPYLALNFTSNINGVGIKLLCNGYRVLVWDDKQFWEWIVVVIPEWYGCAWCRWVIYFKIVRKKYLLSERFWGCQDLFEKWFGKLWGPPFLTILALMHLLIIIAWHCSESEEGRGSIWTFFFFNISLHKAISVCLKRIWVYQILSFWPVPGSISSLFFLLMSFIFLR